MGRPPGAKAVPWNRIVAKLRTHPNKWILFSEMSMVNARTIEVIRKKERRALRLDDGVIRCRRKATLVTDNKVLCTLYLKYVPNAIKE